MNWLGIVRFAVAHIRRQNEVKRIGARARPLKQRVRFNILHYCLSFICCCFVSFQLLLRIESNTDRNISTGPILYMLSNFFLCLAWLFVVFSLWIEKKRCSILNISGYQNTHKNKYVDINIYTKYWQNSVADRRLPLLINSTSHFICISWSYGRWKTVNMLQ